MAISQIKSKLIALAHSMGFERTVVASLSPMQAERKFFEDWLSKGFAGSMQYLQRDPEKRTSPQLLCPEAYCAVVLFASYYTEKPESPGNQFGQVARYAVGQDYHSVIPCKLAQLKAKLENELGKPILGKYYTDDVELYEQALASRNGLGFVGKNTMLIGPKLMGSYHFVAEFFTDLPLEPDEPYTGTCGSCFRCGIACPTNAIVEETLVDARKCISFLTIENKVEIPQGLRESVGGWLFGCDICQEVCPYNQRPPETKWQEFHPSNGAGHYVNLFSILDLKSKSEFDASFAHTALSRPKRFGLQRNALTVIANQLPENGDEQTFAYLQRELAAGIYNSKQIAVLFEHAVWALRKYQCNPGTLSKIADMKLHTSYEHERSVFHSILQI